MEYKSFLPTGERAHRRHPGEALRAGLWWAGRCAAHSGAGTTAVPPAVFLKQAPGNRQRPDPPAATFSPYPPPRDHSQSTDTQGHRPSASTWHRWGTLLSPATLTVPPEFPRAVSSQESLRASTHLCPKYSVSLSTPNLHRCHTAVSPMANALGQVGL